VDAVGTFLAGLTGGAAPIETHVSEVFVGAHIAYKRRKKLRLTFLDFTAAADRRRYAERELALNAPHAPGLYRGVHAITEASDGTLALDGRGEKIDWVVAMAPLPASAFLDAVAAADGLTPALLNAMADAVAAMHASLPPAQGHDLAEVARGNAQAALAAGLPPDRVAAWETACLARIAAQAAWHRGRAATHVRRCHGDLHLGNMVLLQGRPCPFDALEFDEALATIDTGYDLAFLLMDLEQTLGRGPANRVLNRYVARTGDAGLVAGLPAWLSLRAIIRAHVQERQGKGRGLALLAAAEAYLAPPTPLLVAVGGLQGTGKSTLAQALAPELGAAPGALVLRSDAIRKRLAGVAPETRLPEAAYTPAATQAVYATLLQEAQAALAGHHAVVADAVFQRPGERAAIAALAPPGRFLGVWLEAPLPLLQARLEARRNDASDADAAVLAQAAARDSGSIGWARVDASDAAAALAHVRRLLQVA
jgi:aminoglycoside phosphotransferase family enzyme/predicted kinase